MATLIKTVRCKLQVGQEETSILLETMSRFASACQDIREVALEHKTTNKVKLQHLCYQEIKTRYGLQANLALRRQAGRKVSN